MLEAGKASQGRVDIHALTKWPLIWEAFRNLHENPLEKACFGFFCGQTRVGTQCQKSSELFAGRMLPCPQAMHYETFWFQAIHYETFRHQTVRQSVLSHIVRDFLA